MVIKRDFLFVYLVFLLLPAYGQIFSPKDYCLVWSDEFDTNGAPDLSKWRYEEGYVRNKEDQYYTKGRLENAYIENGHLILEARKDNWQGHKYTSASLVSSGKDAKQYGRFEIRAKIDVKPGSWPAFWTLGVAGEWPSNGEIDIMEFYAKKIHANVAWGTQTRWNAHWNSQTKLVSDLGNSWGDEFHIWRMEWTSDFINLYVDDILMNSTDLKQTINGSISNIKNPFHQPHYIVINQAIGGILGGDLTNTVFPVRFEIDYVRIYQLGKCNLDCFWNEGGKAYLDKCSDCVGGKTGKDECELKCMGNMLENPGFETGNTNGWSGWGTRTVSSEGYTGSSGIQVMSGAVEKIVNVLPNTSYTLKCKGRKSGAGWFRLGVKQQGAVDTYMESYATSWTDISKTFTTNNTTSATIYFFNGSTGSAYGDDFILQPTGCYVTATVESEVPASMKIYPNPSENGFTLKVFYTGQIVIYNSLGKLILIKSIEAGEVFEYGQALPTGIYSIKFFTSERSEVKLWTKL